MPRAALWLGLALLASGVALAARSWNARSAPKFHYQTMPIDHGPIAAKVLASGALSALVTVSVGSQVSGRIDGLYADFGSTVKRGQVVATIDPALFKAVVQQAKANRAAALASLARAKAQRLNMQQQYAREKALIDRKLVPQADYDAAVAALAMADADLRAAAASCEQAQAALDQAQLNLRYTTIISPIDGVVISRNVDVGQTVAAALQAPTLFSIAQDLRHMQVDTNVAESDVGKIRAGMNVSFSVDAYPGQTFPGKVRQVRDNAQTLQNVVTYDAVVDVDNAQGLLKPGMTATVSFVYAQRENALRIPNAALRFRPDEGQAPQPPALRSPDERTAWILRAGRAEPVQLRIGISDGVNTEISAGDARPGERAIVDMSADVKSSS